MKIYIQMNLSCIYTFFLVPLHLEIVEGKKIIQTLELFTFLKQNI